MMMMNPHYWPRRVLGAIAATLIGTAFYFAIANVFGLATANVALVLFVVMAVWFVRRQTAQGASA
jgi:hypothetical protein